MLISFLSKIALASFLISLGLAAYVLYQNPRKTENISFAAGMTTLSFIAFCQFMDFHSLDPELWRNLKFSGQIILPVPWLVFSLVFARSDGANHLRKWRVGIGGISLGSLIFLSIFLYICFGKSKLFTFETVRYWTSIFLMLALTLVLSNFEGTMRSGERQQKWRIKFLVFGIASIFFFVIFNFSYLLLFPTTDNDFSFVIPTMILIGTILASFSLVRHSLLGVQIAVSRDVVHNSIIFFLVGTYLLSVGLAAQAIRSFGGKLSLYLQIMFVFLALIFIGLVLLSTHVRKTARMFIDRHFFRSKFDYGKEWLRLTDRLSSKLDVHDLASSLANLFSETFWINTTLLWLDDDIRGGFRMVYPEAGRQNDAIRWNHALLLILKDSGRPLMLDELKRTPELPEYMQEQVYELGEKGISLLVPLMFESRMVGVLGLSQSRYGVPFDNEDLALINTISRQAASSLLSAQLSAHIAQSKELEAFHLFSTFVIHDLKNFVSMLSLIVQNMEKNFGNPAFQNDAMRSLSHTVEKMKRMMARMSALSGTQAPSKSPIDVNGLIREVTNEMTETIQSRVVEDYRDLPLLMIDPEQIKHVIRNLILNADEATNKGGEIRLATEVLNGRVLISVTDDGCGMTKEYVEQGLFTLFSTTKSDGFGVGLYQARRIVESHGGRIEVESEVGRGSTFRIHLPCNGE